MYQLDAMSDGLRRLKRYDGFRTDMHVLADFLASSASEMHHSGFLDDSLMDEW
jgi:hypothetical protein